MKILKQLIIGLVSAIFTSVVILGAYTIYAEDTYDFEATVFDGLLTVKAAYHTEMNDYFNDKIEKLVEILEEDKFYNNENFIAPQGVNLDNYQELCVEENVSSYCVAMGALDRYVAYTTTLSGITGYLISFDYEQTGTKYDLLSQSEYFNEDITIELEESKRVMEGTVAAYNEFRLAYPMHIKFEDIINSLMKYRIALKDIRKQVKKFPTKFVDATSVTCR
ncbi:hypothetical protein ACFL21_00020 [Patescibacteria group bacterium]